MICCVRNRMWELLLRLYLYLSDAHPVSLVVMA